MIERKTICDDLWDTAMRPADVFLQSDPGEEGGDGLLGFVVE